MVQLQIKTLAGDTFTVQCDNADSIFQVKEKIASKTDLKETYTADLLKLLYTGKVLDDEDTLESYSVKSDGFLVLVKQTPGKPKVVKKKPNQGFGFNSAGGFHSPNGMGMPNSFMQSPFQQNSFMQQQQPFQPHPSAASTDYTSPASTNYVPPASTNYTPTVTADSGVSAAKKEEAITQLVNMGFERALCERALRACAYNVETAAEYILADAIPSADDELELPHGAAANQRAGPGGDNSQLQQMRQMLQENPGQLQVLKQQLQAEHPEIAQMIGNDPQKFLDLLNQAGNDGNAPQPPGGQAAGSIEVNLSPQEQQAITRIESMGFERNHVIEAFLVSDRNEEMAINYLLSQTD